MAFKIYTKTGDKGSTGLFGGKRLPKHHIRIESYGNVDELNAFVGMVRDVSTDQATKNLLKNIQDRLFDIGSNLAADPEKNPKVPDVKAEDIEMMEQAMDEMDKLLPPLRAFILPGGHPHVSYCHMARTICRRAERSVVALNDLEGVVPIVLQYLNRLSDYLFVLGRKMAFDLKVEEIKWQARD